MDSRILIDIETEICRGNTGRWILDFLRDQSKLCMVEAKIMVIEDRGTEFTRERLLAKSAHYDELVELLPRLISEQVKQQLEKESQ